MENNVDNVSEELYYEKCMLEDILYPMMMVIDEINGITPQKREQLREETFKIFLERAKRELKGAPKFKIMTIEQLKALYRQVEINIEKVNGGKSMDD